MEKFTNYIFNDVEIETQDIDELPMAIKFGASDHYQATKDYARGKMHTLMIAAMDVKDDFPKANELVDLIQKSQEQLRGIEKLDQDETTKISKEISAILRTGQKTLQSIVAIESMESDPNIRLTEAVLNEAFNKVTCAKTNKEVLNLGKSHTMSNLVRDAVVMASKHTQIDDYAIKGGRILKERMSGDDIKFANLVLSSLSSKLNGNVIPSAKKIGIIEAAKREVADLGNDEMTEAYLDGISFDAEDMSGNYSGLVSMSSKLKHEADKAIGVLRLATLPSDMTYGTNTNEFTKEAISSLKTIKHQLELAENRASHIEGVQDNIGHVFQKYGLGSMDSNQKAYDQQETDWYLRYADEGTEAYNELKDYSQSVEFDQKEYDEALRLTEELVNQHLNNEIIYAHKSISNEIKLHLSAKKNNDYTM